MICGGAASSGGAPGPRGFWGCAGSCPASAAPAACGGTGPGREVALAVQIQGPGAQKIPAREGGAPVALFRVLESFCVDVRVGQGLVAQRLAGGREPRHPGLGFRRTTFVDSDTTGLEETQRHDIQDVDLYALFFVGLGMTFERAATSVSFDRLPHVLHLVPQLFWAAPLVQAVIASDVERARTEVRAPHRLPPAARLCVVPTVA